MGAIAPEWGRIAGEAWADDRCLVDSGREWVQPLYV